MRSRDIWPKWEIDFYKYLIGVRRDEAMRAVNEKVLPYFAMTKGTRRYWACVKSLQRMVDLPGSKRR